MAECETVPLYIIILKVPMKKPSRLFLSLLVLSGGILNACAPKEQPVIEEDVPSEPVENTSVEENETEATTPAVKEEPADSAPLSLYMDGTYQQNGTYNSPAGVDTLGVSLTVKNDVVTAVDISVLATNEGSIYFQGLFADGIADFVVGKPLEELTGVSVVNGASLTPLGFNQALSAIKTEALR